jgi:hypothetical protein
MLGAIGIQGELMQPTELGEMVQLMPYHGHVELPAGGRRIGTPIDRPVADGECQATAWAGARGFHATENPAASRGGQRARVRSMART